MAEKYSYADAVRLLGGGTSRTVTALDNLAGGVLLGGSLLLPGLLALFDAKAELARLSHQLVNEFGERRHGLRRYDRTQRLAAAHTVIVVAAFFEALAEADLPLRFADLELTPEEQLQLAARPRTTSGSLPRRAARSPIPVLFEYAVPAPAAHQPFEDFRTLVHAHYVEVAKAVVGFVDGLAVWERLSQTDQHRYGEATAELPDRAITRYDELLGKLAADFPEVAFWAQVREHEGTRVEVRQARAQVRELAASLAGMERVLAAMSADRDAADVPAALRRTYAATLDRAVLQSGEVPPGLSVPTLGSGYVPPLFRVAVLGQGDRPSDESWWSHRPVRDDLPAFLLGHLTSPAATRAPLLVLGQPGSGKSVLTRALAARLPAEDFLPVRVVLRDVSTVTDLQEQIEYAVREATGERLDWPALCRSAGGALPVVLLDGFDELVQATGVSQTDYLTRVARFQLREADQGRPVVVVVTSRTSVADRALPPDGTIAVRLEPFDESRVAAWLDVWNAVNAEHFERRGVAPLAPETVLAHPDLAGQPLLLLMLALYDADGNALRAAGELRREELYERLLDRFARREVFKHRPHLTGADLEAAVTSELHRLGVVAFAIFNRGTQWVTKQELDKDLAALLGPPPSGPPGGDLRAPLRPADIVIGRFFFIHRARVVTGDDEGLETYEFLHATFGEFLVARLVWQVLSAMLAQRAAALGQPFGEPEPVDDGRLHALLSWAALCGRAPVIEFLAGMASTLDDRRRDMLVELLVGLFRAANWSRAEHRYDDYRPRPLPVPARHAAYGVNLLLLAVCVAGRLRGSRLYGPDSAVIPPWHRQALLWRSQLTGDDWQRLLATLALDRIWVDGADPSGDGSSGGGLAGGGLAGGGLAGGDSSVGQAAGGQAAGRDIELRLAGPDEPPPPPIDLAWTRDLRSEPQSAEGDTAGRRRNVPARRQFRRDPREANLLCGVVEDLTHHALEPLTAAVPNAVESAVGYRTTSFRTAGHELVALLLTPTWGTADEERVAVYRRWADLAYSQPLPVTLLLERLAADDELPALDAVEILRRLPASYTTTSSPGGPYGLVWPPPEPYLRCVRAILGRDQDADREIARLLLTYLPYLLGGPGRLGTDHPAHRHLRAVLIELDRLGLTEEATLSGHSRPS